MTPAERAALVERYRGGYAAFAAAVAGAGDRLDRPAPDGGWTGRQVVHHLADSELTSALRLRRLLAEDAPVIAGYDENAFARVLRYDRPVDAALRAVEAARATSAELLGLLTEAEWARAGTHTESGPYGVEDWLRTYAAHPYDHAEQLRRVSGG
ncbi:MAG TPA: DinB family protein [Mycobacteriales bacterium]|nr:DinB family protein [Mycobacteriales bacterium]